VSDEVEQEIDPADFRAVLGHYCSGITIITAQAEDGPTGFTCQSFSSVSLDPPLVAFFPSRTSTSWKRIKSAGHFCANVLADDQIELSQVFATSGADKFANATWLPGPSGAPLLDGCLAHIDCELEAVHDAGDHEIAVGRVLHLAGAASRSPLVYFRGAYRTIAEEA
jgi:3-hydroxy-9,10-secoandrosta-1,3,5(10)-triene-9,17-dione monooxygenase reductase component